jgi:predicted secreted protein
MQRFGILASVVLTASLAFAAPVLAAAPGNDTYAGRTVIGSIPFSASIDTTEATTDADDAQVAAGCGAVRTDFSVWYEMTAPSDGAFVVDANASTYSAGVIVAIGTPGGFKAIACGPYMVAFNATAGETYSILAFDFQADAVNGGTLNIVVDHAPPPLEVHVTVNPTGRFNAKTGSATISGTVTCTGIADKSLLTVHLRQTVGRVIVSGSGYTEYACDQTTQQWTVEVLGDNGLFKGGHAVSVTTTFACGPIGCSEDFTEQVVQLRR